MPLWAVLACTVLGTVGNVLTYMAMVKANRKMEEKRNSELIAREAKQSLKLEQCWQDYKDRHNITYDNGE